MLVSGRRVPTFDGFFVVESYNDDLVVRVVARECRDPFSSKGDLDTPRFQRGRNLIAVLDPFPCVFYGDMSDKVRFCSPDATTWNPGCSCHVFPDYSAFHPGYHPNYIILLQLLQNFPPEPFFI